MDLLKTARKKSASSIVMHMGGLMRKVWSGEKNRRQEGTLTGKCENGSGASHSADGRAGASDSSAAQCLEDKCEVMTNVYRQEHTIQEEPK